MDDISLNFDEIMAGTTNHLDPMYIAEASADKRIEQDSKKFIKRMTEMISSWRKSVTKKSDLDTDSKLIWASGGDFKKIKNGQVDKCIKFVVDQYKSIEHDQALMRDYKIDKLKEPITKIKEIREKLIQFTPLYEKGFDLKIDLIQEEFDCFVTGVLMYVTTMIVNSTYLLHEYKKINPDIKIKVGESLSERLNKKNFFAQIFDNIASFFKWIKGNWLASKTLNEIHKILTSGDHREYLETLIKVYEDKPTAEVKSKPIKKSLTGDSTEEPLKEKPEESKEEVKTESAVFTEAVPWAAAGELMKLVFDIPNILYNIQIMGMRVYNIIKNSLKAVIPLLRIHNYLRQEKKLNTISVLEEEVEFLERNIKKLEESSSLPADKKQEVIKKQKALMMSHQRKIAKIKAEFDLIDVNVKKKVQANDKKIQSTTSSNSSSGSSSPSSGDDLVLG